MRWCVARPIGTLLEDVLVLRLASCVLRLATGA